MAKKTIYEWAVEYCGDPASHVTRGSEILSYLIEQGLKPHHKVLDLGCGALSQGVPLIRYLQERRYVGLDPNGWLIEAALQEHRDLESKSPHFGYGSDFIPPADGPYDFVIAHSVLSHVAHWQMHLAFHNIHKSVVENGVWVASFINDQYNSFSREWQYPGVSKFNFQTIQTIAYNAGWNVCWAEGLKERIIAACPNDTHDWLIAYRMDTPAEMNERRLALEEEQRVSEAVQDSNQAEYEREERVKLLELQLEMRRGS